MTVTNPTELLESLKAAQVLCVGDIMLDRFVSGEVERISPEAPIPVLKVTGETTMPGGVGNVARNLGTVGVTTKVVSLVGEDTAAETLSEFFDDHDSVTVHFIPDAAQPTTTKTRFVAGAQQMLRADRDPEMTHAAGVMQSLVTRITECMANCSVVLLSDYGKGVLTDSVCHEVIAAAKAVGKTVIVDPKGSDFSKYRGASLITPNRAELSKAIGHTLEGAEEIEQAARKLIVEHDLGALLVTLGADGMMLIPAEGEVTALPTQAQEVFDVSGAGDTVVAFVAAGVAAGQDMITAIRLANAAAGVVVGKVGTAVAHPGEILAAFLLGTGETSLQVKRATLAEAKDKVAAWRRQGHSIGFTNGCFDLIHPGHISLLTQAKQHCDRLIVGLNSDDSVRRLKGKSRPVQDEHARATVLASLSDVDLVIVFEDNTPIELIESLKPDVLVKGADYTVETVVGADIVQANGGRIVLVDLVDGQSTTRTIAKLAS